jgi:hypothetical protein
MTNTIFNSSLAAVIFGFIFFGAFVPFVLIGFVVVRVGLSIGRGGRRLASGRVRWLVDRRLRQLRRVS